MLPPRGSLLSPVHGEARMQFLLAAILIVFAAARADAQVSDDERARTHFEAGRSYYEQARYDDSAREFKEAFALSGRPALLLNLSQAYERGLHFAEASAEIKRYLEIVPETPDRKTLEERIARLEELQARVQPTAAGAPAPAQGAQSQPQPKPESQPATQPAPAASAPTAARGEEDSGLFVPGVVLVASGGAVLAGSIVIGLIAHGKYSDLEDLCGSGPCPASAQDDIDSGETLATVSTVLMGVGIVAAGIGAALLIVDANHHSGDKPHAESGDIRLAGAPTPLGLGAQLTF